MLRYVYLQECTLLRVLLFSLTVCMFIVQLVELTSLRSSNVKNDFEIVHHL